MASEKIEAPLPGKIFKVNIKPGDKVSEGDEIFVIEAMKMENPIISPVSGVVKEVQGTQGKVVKANEVIAIIET